MPDIAGRPAATEYAEYFHRYISLVDSDDVVSALEAQLPETVGLIRTLDPDYRYAPGKWTVKQVVGHMIDTERVMSYRALRISRADPVALPGFDQDVLMQNAVFEQQPIEDLVAEFETVRKATLYQLRPLTGEAWTRSGMVSGGPATTRSLAYVIAGHEKYHGALFREKYRG